jgi:hypothetical protein
VRKALLLLLLLPLRVRPLQRLLLPLPHHRHHRHHRHHQR